MNFGVSSLEPPAPSSQLGITRQFVQKVLSNNNDNRIPVRTIYIAPLKQHIIGRIRSHFGQFGLVESIRLHTKDDFQYGFVQYGTADAAEKALARSPHWFGNCFVKAKIADVWHQPDYNKEPPHPLSMPPDSDSDLNILNALNDDCLRVVFKHLDILDLSNAAEVCVRFNQHAKQVFSSKYKNLNAYDMHKFYDRFDAAETAMFRNFGSFICSISIIDSRTVPLINKYATSQLKELKLMHFKLNRDIKIDSLLENIQVLVFYKCKIDNFRSPLASAANLKVLHIKSCKWNGKSFINQRFVKLEEFQLVNHSSLNDDELCDFIKMNPTLKKLSIEDRESPCTPKIIQLISQHLPNLTELKVDQEFVKLNEFEKYLPTLGQLKSLKSLTLHFDSVKIEPLLKSLVENEVPIEELTLKMGENNDSVVACISQLKQIKMLEFNDIENVTEDHMIAIAKELPLLQELTLKESSTDDITSSVVTKIIANATKLMRLVLKSADSLLIDLDDYQAILKSVQNRKEKKLLWIDIRNCGSDSVEVDEEMRNKNREWLLISEIFDDYEDDYDTYDEYSDYLDSDDFDDYDDLDGYPFSDSSDDFGYSYFSKYRNYFDYDFDHFY